MTLGPVFRAVAETVVPEAAALDERGWRDLERVIEEALAPRPPKLRRQIRLLLRAINVLAVFRHGSRFVKLDPARRASFLRAVQDAPITLLRVGFWGLRTLVFMGYYGRPEGAAAIGYGATTRGWGR